MIEEKRKAHILVVDDIPGNIKTLVSILDTKYEVLIATNGRKALETVLSGVVDLILLDLLMPEMDGYEVIKRLKGFETTKDIPIIVVTSNNEISDEIQALRLGAVDFLTKPVNSLVVLARVETHLGLKRAREILNRQNLELQVIRKTLEVQNLDLLEAVKMREDVERIMHHDLKGPLNIVLGFSDLLKKELKFDEHKAEMCQYVLDAGYNLLNMINLSLDLYKMEKKLYQMNPIPVDIMGLFVKINESYHEQFTLKDVSVNLVLDGRLAAPSDKVLIMGEELLCYSLFNNLIKNAIEASPEGADIDLLLSCDEVVKVRIRNVGTVPPDILGRFFEKYVTSGKPEGTGLGTYSARLMVEAQGGSIRVETSGEDSTSIIVQLPQAL